MRRTIACTIAVLALAVTAPIALAQSVMTEGEKILLEGAKSSITPAAPGAAASGVPGAAGAAGSVPGTQVPGAQGATTLIPGGEGRHVQDPRGCGDVLSNTGRGDRAGIGRGRGEWRG